MTSHPRRRPVGRRGPRYYDDAGECRSESREKVMTEGEWLECQNPRQLFDSINDRASDRKARLIAAAYCRWRWHELTEPRSREAVEVAERFADGLASADELLAAHRGAVAVHAEARCPVAGSWYDAAVEAECVAADDFREWDAQFGGIGGPHVAGLVRDAFGGLFRPNMPPPLMSPIIAALAQAAYDERIMPSGELDTARLAVLSDALEEAGCDNDDILNHLRGPGPHVRGCWALHLILGKE